ncbi:phosphomannomutase [Phyllobacterium zundukense]|uniref:Phosphomannomutase n=1 Tax=Phyllobacterium zundukense TaxID=1867719 RepID=A0A2N9VVD9_9HYPH|nr:phosphomannomutase [Phyllobacterium zundukense]ATU93995.1 phosphomannomutase [Phyllobacterium zundukense]PIO43457.1 phosphomannomutase [Phyllobacterium zundukense]
MSTLKFGTSGLRGLVTELSDALKLKAPAIMVTGSHIPADRNGLKFYRPDGEIDKADEAGILSSLLMKAPESVSQANQLEIAHVASEGYAERCVGVLQPNALAGKRIGVYQHSSVARDLIVGVLEELGADVIALGRSDVFVPFDTEALRPEDVAFAAESRKWHLDALVSTDGDADRPLIADDRGTFLRGDSVGLLTARFLGADAVVTPVTSNTAVELSGLFTKVYRTKVGSPYVIEGMAKAIRDNFRRVVGFEANGGVLLGSTILADGRQVDALPIRDALLPILAVLGMAAKEALAVSQLLDSLPQRFTRSGRIEHVEATVSGPFLQSLGNERHRDDFFSRLGAISEYDAIDGIRTVLATGEVVHFRASGNAPELRCYAEADYDERAEFLLQWALKRAEDVMELDNR